MSDQAIYQSLLAHIRTHGLLSVEEEAHCRHIFVPLEVSYPNRCLTPIPLRTQRMRYYCPINGPQ